MEKNKRVFRVSKEKDLDVAATTPVSTGSAVVLRVYVDHERNVRPAFYAQIEHADPKDGEAFNGLVPVLDLDATKLANAVLRAQAEILRRTAEWEAEEEERARLRAFCLPPVVLTAP